jgi:hypothetical protein
MAAARAAAAAAAARMGLSAGAPASAEAEPSADAESAKRAAAASFADSLKKRSRWGDGSTALVDAPAVREAGKERQALVVSQLKDKLAAFRADRGVDTPAEPGAKLSLKLFVPEKAEGAREPRNWVVRGTKNGSSRPTMRAVYV